MYNNEFQEYVVDILTATIAKCKEKNISRELFFSYGSNHALKRGLITHYASIYKYENEFKNLWQNSQIKFCEPILMTEKVYSIVEEVKKNYNGSYAKYKETHKNEETNLIYWEHITPNEIVWQRVVDVFDDYNKNSFTYNELREKIKDCFYGHRLLLITKTEQMKLDKIGGRTGERVNGIDNINNIKSRNIAEKRIKLLFEQCGVDSLYLNGKHLEEKDLFDSDENFINEVKDYFTECNFSIE